MRRRVVWMAALAALIGLGVPVARAGGVRAWLMASVTPRAPFSAAEVPPPPDYTSPAAWSALPELADLGDTTPAGIQAVAPDQAPADLFYLHSTSSVAPAWNAPVDDPKVMRASDRGGVLIQASAFNNVAAIYAPRYRQASGTAFQVPSPDGAAAIDVAYRDVTRAFDTFLARRAPDRPFLLAAHSQGAFLMSRLLARRISGTPLRDRLVAAWIVGGALTYEKLAREAPDVPACAGPRDVGCVLAWNARSPTYTDGVELWYPPGEHRVCTNPLSGVGEGGAMPASANLGAVFLQRPDPGPFPGFADARCAAGTLRVNLFGRVPRDLPSRILAGVMGKGNHHPIEYELFWSNIRADAAVRVAAWQAAHGG